MVDDCHEFVQCWVPEDGIVRQADVGDIKVDEFSVVVVTLAEGDREANLPYRVCRTVGHS